MSMLNHVDTVFRILAFLNWRLLYATTLQSSSLLSVRVSADSNVFTHFCWDNFDLQEETVSGSGTTCSAHGIVIQELSATSAGY